MIIFIRSSDFDPDPRAQKYIEFVTRQNIEYRIIGWSRSGLKMIKPNSIFLHKKAKYGKKLGNTINKLLWMLFVFFELVKLNRKIDTIHAVDVDSALPSFIFTTLFKKDLIFDVYDWIGQNGEKKSKILDFIEKVENLIVKGSTVTIVCDEARINQIDERLHSKVIVFKNIPSARQIDKYKHNKFDAPNQIVKISYVGVFDFNRGIENLLETVHKYDFFELHIAGFGALESLVKKYSRAYNNIKYYGKTDYEQSLSIISDSQLLYGCYYTTNPLHIFAAPNKYYESLMCGTPLITTKNTLVGQKVEEGDTGFVIGETQADLEALFCDAELNEKIVSKTKRCREIWESNYANYVSDFMERKYNIFIQKESIVND